MLIVPDLVGLSVALQVLNAVLLPVVVGLLFWLARLALPDEARPAGGAFRLAAAAATVVCLTGLAGALAGLV